MIKKLLSLFTLFMAAGAALNLQAQTPLTAANFSPQLGEHFNLKMATYMPPGNAGANQTWNFSGMVTSSNTTSDYVSRAAAPFPANVPAANLVSKSATNEYEYIETTPTAIRTHGAYSAAQNMFITYSNPLDINLPINYNGVNTDAYKATFSTNGLNFTRIGTATISYDGYGTVITPAGTFSNILRLKIMDVLRDSANFGGTFPYVINTTIETYDYILTGTHIPLLRLVKMTSGTTVQSGAIYLDASSISGQAEELAQEMKLNVYPNPASEAATIQFKLKAAAKVKVSLLNIVGQEVLNLQEELVTAENQTQTLPVGNLPKGVYFVKISIGDKVATKRLVLE